MTEAFVLNFGPRFRRGCPGRQPAPGRRLL